MAAIQTIPNHKNSECDHSFLAETLRNLTTSMVIVSETNLPHVTSMIQADKSGMLNILRSQIFSLRLH